MSEHLGEIETQLLLAAAQHRSSADWFDLHSPDAVDWPAAFAAAREQGVFPLLVRMPAPQSQVIGKPYQRAYQEMRLNHLRNMHLMAELERINQCFASAGIRMLPYKGPTLALCAYGDLALRQAGDLDLLVSPNDAEAAERLLLDAGYVAKASQSEIAEASAHDYHREFEHPERRTMVELHWRVVGECFSFEPSFEDFWKRGSELAVGDHPVRIMSAADTLLVLAAHGMKHFWSRLGWICDIAELIRANPATQWQEAIDRAEQLGGRRIVLLAMQLAHDICGIDCSAAFPKSIRKGAAQVRKHLFAKRSEHPEVTRGMRMELAGGGRWSSLLFHWRMRERASDGVRYMLHRVFTPTAIEKEWINLPVFLRPSYFLARPVRLALK